MKILLANKFFFEKGGAEKSFFATARLLERKGHEVRFFSMQHPRNLPSRDDGHFVTEVSYEAAGPIMGLRAAGRMLYSLEARGKLGALLDAHPVDLAHLNNIYHQISPSILHTLRKRGVPIVMTLRDYKIVCGSYQLLARGSICEDCRGGSHYHSVLRRCIQGSGAKSLLTMAEMYLHHSLLRIYDLVDVFIAPSVFLKDKVRQMGFRGRIVHLPNFADTDHIAPCYGAATPRFVYTGRLVKEKGLDTLLTAVQGLDIELRIVGEGPMQRALEERIRSEGISNVRLLGYLSGLELQGEIAAALAVVLPSELYENNPRSVIEAFALGKPAIGARIGGIPELVRDGLTGLCYPPADPDALRQCLRYMATHAEETMEMGRRARRLVETELSPDRHYDTLLQVYRSAAGT